MSEFVLWVWSGLNHLLAVLNDIISFKLVFIIPLLLFYMIHRSWVVLKRKGKV